MTKLLEQAIAEIGKLPGAGQDRAAHSLFGPIQQEGQAEHQLPPVQVERGRLGLAQAQRGEFADPQDIEELWRRFGL
ncbi:hypothetical protein EZH22_22835 [Xanthobacter dioxanivorans]|uniref:Uncharacterized protein n=1 Tax=Xanthobacter dioxanivorans TaxID=2528964 RepID=A0A974PLK1_9HYPH|nr:hypothetical protein [Xanthobacter dioxanivorans]QRG05837.1 hypothetical protein EZH22_22835 [Xanthobacter dioxanivorans]